MAYCGFLRLCVFCSLDTDKELVMAAKKKGKKDACYHKVKSRFRVFPSAYASGALVRCRKVGAARAARGRRCRKV